MVKYANRLMKLLSRVVWSEGMHLGPHHFQVQSRYFEDSIQFATSSLWFAAYGLAGLELDADALYNGSVSLLHARGILPDGLPFNMPESDDLPAPRTIAELIPPTRDGVIVLLGIPPLKPNGMNCTLDAQTPGDARYASQAKVLHDEISGVDERSVHLGRKNLRLLLDTEPAGDLDIACREFRLGPPAPPAHRQARPPRGTLRRTLAAGRRALHFLARFQAPRPAAVRSSKPDRLLQSAGSPHPRPPGNRTAYQLHFDPPGRGRRLFLRGQDFRCALSGQFTLGARHPRRHGGGRPHDAGPATRQGLHAGLRARTGQPRPARHAADPSADTAARHFHARRNAVFWDRQSRALLEPHAADATGGSVCPERVSQPRTAGFSSAR